MKYLLRFLDTHFRIHEGHDVHIDLVNFANPRTRCIIPEFLDWRGNAFNECIPVPIRPAWRYFASTVLRQSSGSNGVS